jgi:hypothetical protein
MKRVAPHRRSKINWRLLVLRSDRVRDLTILTFTLLVSTSAYATMPRLTPKPQPATPTTCKEWAAKQDNAPDADAIQFGLDQFKGATSGGLIYITDSASCQAHNVVRLVAAGYVDQTDQTSLHKPLADGAGHTFFERAPDRGVAGAIDDAEFHDLVLQQPQGPARASQRAGL